MFSVCVELSSVAEGQFQKYSYLLKKDLYDWIRSYDSEKGFISISNTLGSFGIAVRRDMNEKTEGKGNE